MTAGPLAGHGILITRPEHQAAELSAAVEAAGGTVLLLPLLEIVPREPHAISADEKTLPRPDLVVYVSPNAVRYGFKWQVSGAGIAAVGPATKAELVARGVSNIICQNDGFDSEHLLAHEALAEVSGKNIRIIRGQGGRELLGDTLRDRGARVDYLAVYLRRARRIPDSDRHRLETNLSDGRISCITIMSVATMECLMDLFPVARHDLLRRARLVTPSSRVLKNISELMPGLPATLAPGPQADEMILGLTACLKQDNTE